jgi:RHS repeat-associated protein
VWWPAEGGRRTEHGERQLWGGDDTDARFMPLRFPGQYADDETGWHYNYYRHYDPAIARSTTPDPLGLEPSPNPFGYPENPHLACDPLGLAPYGPGDKMPNYTLFPPDGLNIMGTPVVVSSPEQLSTLLQPNMGMVHWAACSDIVKIK